MNLQKNKRFRSVRSDFEDAFESLISKYCFDGLDEGEAVRHTSDRFARLIRLAGGPEFDSQGYIPPIHSCTDVEAVRWFGWSEDRARLLPRIREWIALARAVGVKRLLLDGSFVTAKTDPRDVDAVVLLPANFEKMLESGNADARRLAEMFLRREPQELFAAGDDEAWWAWFDFFSQTREKSGRRKGLIEVLL